MKQLKMIILLFIITCIIFGCPSNDEQGHQYIAIVNRSSENIRCQPIWRIKIALSDTVYQCDNIPFHISGDSTCLFPSGETHRGLSWEDDFKVIPYVQFLIVDEKVYHQYYLETCDTIRKYVPILHRYQLKLEDLQRMNWTVVYPPEE